MVRRTVRTQAAFLFAGAFAGLVAAGTFRPGGGALPWYALAALAVWGALFTRTAFGRFRDEGDAAELSPTASSRTLAFVVLPRLRADFEIGVLLLVLTFAVVEFAGGVTSPLYPLVYVLVAFYVSFYPRVLGLALAAATILIETAIVLSRHGIDREVLFIHAAFIGFFALLNLVFTHTEIFRLRHRGEMRLRQALQRVREAARDFRLSDACGAPAAAGPDSGRPDGASAADRRARDPLRSAVSSVHQIQETLFDTLDLLKQTLSLHTCAVLWLDADGARLKPAEIVTDAEEIDLGPYPAADGAVGAALRAARPLALGNLRPDYRGLPYYRGPIPVGSFLAAPVREGDVVRGVLVADRAAPEPFGPRERAILERAAERVARTIQNERAFMQLEKAKAEQGCLYAASQRLAGAIREGDVLDAALEAASAIAPFDAAAIALWNEEARQHTIRRTAGDVPDGLADLTFPDNQGLAAMALRTKHYLPYRGEFDDRGQVVWAAKGELRGMGSLLVLPLVTAEAAIGTLALAARRRGAFRDDVRPLLQVLANQVATSLLNARMVRRLAEAATTDALTGLANRRTFEAEIERRIRSAERFRKPLSLILCDLDHFKRINDTHGHPAGDDVLRGFADVLRECKRDPDLVARWGGEEFAVLCEETDAAGARLLAERIRGEMQACIFRTGAGEFHATCSLGIATFPTHARNREELLRRADQALYAAKESGRNTTVAAPPAARDAGRRSPAGPPVVERQPGA